jgi:two-component system cell cycle sensor histidine kinase/response regulator CckA
MSGMGSIVAVDDTLESLQIITEILQAEGYAVRAADSGTLALASVRARRPDLILLDVRMPDMSGLEVCAALKADASTRDIPIIFLSASTEFSERLEGFRLGGVDFVTKPFQREELLARVHTHMELGRLRGHLENLVAERTQALMVSHARLSLAMDIAKLGYWEYDIASDAFRFDEDFFKLYGTSGAREGGHVLSSREYERRFLFPEDAGLVARGIEAALADHSGQPVQLEHRMRRADGSLGHVLVRYVVVRDENGKATRLYGANQDVSQRKQAEATLEQLRHVQKLDSIGRLAGGIAHDFNNLLAVVLGHLELVDVRKGEPAVKRHVGEAVQAAHSAAALTRQLLLFARNQPAAPVALQLNDVVTRTHRMLRRLIGEDIALELRVEPDLPRVWMDPGRAEQVLINLAVNARDAMPSGGSLTISTRSVSLDGAKLEAHGLSPRVSRFVALRVQDTGVGMDTEVLSHIFEPFFTTKGVGQGTGIGLATVHGVIRQAGGLIEVTSRPGEGSSFDVYVPVTERESAVAAPVDDEIPEGRGELVALVEDQSAVRALARSQLELLGYRVCAFGSAEEALAALTREPRSLQLLLTDVILGGMDGPSLVAELHKTEPELAALYMTGYTDDRELVRTLTRGSTRVMNKPFTIRELARAVRSTIDSRGPA